MATKWDRILVFGLTINFIGQCFSTTFSDVSNGEPALTDDSIFYPDTADDIDNVDKRLRLSKFVRIGKALSSFVRIGKSGENQDPFYDAVDVADDNDIDKRKSAFVRIGRGDVELETPDKRLSSFVRIGRIPTDYEKRRASFIRMGKFPSSAYLRSRGRFVNSVNRPPYFRRRGRFGKSSFIRIGKRDTRDALERMENNERNEQNMAYPDVYRLLQKETDAKISSESKETDEQESKGNFDVANKNFGYGHVDTDMDADKRYSKIVRIGRNDDAWNQMRDNNNNNNNNNKMAEIDDNPQAANKRRGSSFVRIGRTSLLAEQPLLDLIDKRLSSFVRIGKNHYPSFFESDDKEKMEKRKSSFVRIGKSGSLDTQNSDEFGEEPDKRLSSFVRIGKDVYSPDDTYMEDKRLTSIVRIGKKSTPELGKTHADEETMKQSDAEAESNQSKFDQSVM